MSHAPSEAAPDSGLEELSTWPFRAEEGAGQQIDLAKSSGRTTRRDLTAYTHSLADDQVDQQLIL